MAFEKDQWLERIFHSNVFRVTFKRTGGAASLKLDEEGFYYAKIPVDAIAQLRHLTKEGFYVADVNMILGMKLNRSYKCPRNKSVLVREVRPSDTKSLLRIAATVFRYSRFHMDPLIPKATADEVKKQWILNCIRKKRGDHLFVAERGGAIAGFLSTLAGQVEGRPASFIDLIAVSPACFRKGVGEELVRHFLKHSCLKMSHVRVGTQAANIPSIRLYEKCGFKMEGSQFVLHAHV